MATITNYDEINESDIVGAEVVKGRWASAQPAGWLAVSDGSGWKLTYNAQVEGFCGNLQEVKEAIVSRHNEWALGEGVETARAWSEFYQSNPEIARQAKRDTPEIYDAIQASVKRNG